MKQPGLTAAAAVRTEPGFAAGVVALTGPPCAGAGLARIQVAARLKNASRFQRQTIDLSRVFAGQNVGIKQVSERVWLVTFTDHDLGYFDDETCRLEPVDNPFGTRLSPMS